MEAEIAPLVTHLLVRGLLPYGTHLVAMVTFSVTCCRVARDRELERKIKAHMLSMQDRRRQPKGTPQEEMEISRRELEIVRIPFSLSIHQTICESLLKYFGVVVVHSVVLSNNIINIISLFIILFILSDNYSVLFNSSHMLKTQSQTDSKWHYFSVCKDQYQLLTQVVVNRKIVSGCWWFKGGLASVVLRCIRWGR